MMVKASIVGVLCGVLAYILGLPPGKGLAFIAIMVVLFYIGQPNTSSSGP